MTDYGPPRDDSARFNPPTGEPRDHQGLSVPAPTSQSLPQASVPPPPTLLSALPAPSGLPYGAATSGAGYSMRSAPREPWRDSTDVFAWLTVGLLAVHVALLGYLVVLDSLILTALQDPTLDRVLELSDSAANLPAIFVLLYVSTAVVFLIWLHRVWTSDRSDPRCYSRSSGLAVGGWLIPIAAWVLGPLALRDLWNGTRQGRPGAETLPRRMPGLVTSYAIVWALSSLITFSTRGALAKISTADTRQSAIARLEDAVSYELGASLLSAVAAVLLIVVIRRIVGYTRR